jgi:ATP-dependent DNA helicase RecG
MIVSEINTQITIDFLTQKRENQYFERKGVGEKDISPTKIANELIGMLNADGGILVLGVSDTGDIQDINRLGEKLSDYRNLYVDFIVPHGNVKLEEVEIEGKLVFIYHVEQDIERIFKRKDNEQIYLRVDDKNRLLDRDAVRKLEYDKQIRKFEDEIYPDFDFNDIDMTLLLRYKEKLNYSGDILDLLVKRHLAIKKGNDYKIKKSGHFTICKRS